MTSAASSVPALDRRRRRGQPAYSTLEMVVAYGFYALLALLILYPLAWVLLGSFKNPAEIFSVPTTFFPRDFTWTNYGDVIRRTALLRGRA